MQLDGLSNLQEIIVMIFVVSVQLFMMLAGQVLAAREELNEGDESQTRRKSSSSSMKIRPNPRPSPGKKNCC